MTNSAVIATRQRGKDSRRKLKHPRDTFHAFMYEDAKFEPRFDMPVLKPETIVPDAIVPFSLAKRADWDNFDCAVHFCERDSDIEPFWNNPGRYIDKLLKFQAVIGLDFSTCSDFPRPLKEWNVFRNRVCDNYIQQHGQHVLPLLRGDPDTIEREVSGLEKNSMFAISPRGCIKEVDDRKRFERGLKFAVDSLEPKAIISYGGDGYGVLDYPISLNIPVHIYPSRVRGDFKGSGLSVKVR